MNFITGGLYILKDQYYHDYPDKYLKQNKQEHRPFYFCFEDDKTGLYWMIPLSSSPNKIALARLKEQQGKTDIFHFTRIDGKDGVMLIADMCPVSAEYISDEYQISNTHVVFKDRKDEINISAIRKICPVKIFT